MLIKWKKENPMWWVLSHHATWNRGWVKFCWKMNFHSSDACVARMLSVSYGCLSWLNANHQLISFWCSTEANGWKNTTHRDRIQLLSEDSINALFTKLMCATAVTKQPVLHFPWNYITAANRFSIMQKLSNNQCEFWMTLFSRQMNECTATK